MKSRAEIVEAPPRLNTRSEWPVSLLLALAGLILAGLGVLFFFDPMRYGFYPGCLFKHMTGYDCPGCGGLRALHQLLHGHLWQALRLNALVVFAVPVLTVWAAWRWLGREEARPARPGAVMFWGWFVLVVLVLFGIIRNLPWWPFGVTPS